MGTHFGNIATKEDLMNHSRQATQPKEQELIKEHKPKSTPEEETLNIALKDPKV